MTVFTAIQKAALRVTGTKITDAFASSQQVAVELADLSNEVATDIMKGNEWRNLTKVYTISGSNSTSFPLPSDYDRMLASTQVDDPGTWFWGYEPFIDVNEWMRYTNGQYQSFTPGGWIIIGGEVQFYPAVSGSFTFPYISNLYARDEEGTLKAEFDRDNDTFVLDERLLTLGMIWRWKEQKGLEYAEDMQTYELALAQAQARDRGSYVLREPRRYFSGSFAYTGRAIR